LLHPSDHDAELSEEEFRLLRDHIHERFGLYFDESQRQSLRTRLAGRLQALDLLSYEEYYRYLRFGPQREEELERMITHLTNNETYFYREVTQLKALVEQIGDKSLRILSAGCSTGEEVHTLAMMIHDSGQFFWGWEVEVIGLDVDGLALEKARRGLYFHNSFRGLAPEILSRHFVPEGRGHVVKEPIRRMVELRRGNLLDPESYAGLPRLDAVICRNVLIYFSDDAIMRAVSLFGEALAPGGYLLLGHAESLTRLTDSWAPIRFQGAVIYQSQGGAR